MTGADDEAAEAEARRGPAGGAGRAIDPCPICGRPVDAALRPFCSQRCADVDLGRWLGERYVIPGPDDPDENGHA